MNNQEFIDLINQYARHLDNADIELSGEPEIEAFSYYSGGISDIELSTDDMQLDTVDGDYPCDIRYFNDSRLESLADAVINKLMNHTDNQSIAGAISETLRGSVIVAVDNGELVTRSAEWVAREVILSLETGAV